MRGISAFLLSFLFLSFLFIIAPVTAEEANAPKQIILSVIENEETHAGATLILQEAYRRLGFEMNVSLLPGKRALLEANEGITDGDVARIKGTEKKFPNLVPVPTPIINFQGVVFTKNVDKKIEKWSDLEGLVVGIVRGIRYSDLGTKNLDRVLARDMTHLFKILEFGRVDVAVAVDLAGKREIERNYPESGIHVVGKPVFKAPLFHYIHKNKAHLVPHLDRVLKQMKSDGELDRLYHKGY